MSTTSITSGTDFIGKTLVIGSTALIYGNPSFSRIFDFNNSSTDVYIIAPFRVPNGSLRYGAKPTGSGEIRADYNNYIPVIDVYYIYTIVFLSLTQLKVNVYQYNTSTNDVSNIGTTVKTINMPNTILPSITKFWLGRSIYNSDHFYNGRYDKVALYNGDLLALTNSNVCSTLLTLVTSTQTNIINNSTTYTFRALGTNFLGVVVNILNVNTISGSNVTTSNITLYGTNSISGGYLNIIGSYIESAPIIMHNFNSANKSFIMYAHTLSSISGDDLTLKPNAGKNLILEVSGNNSVLIKKGTNVFDLTNLSTGTTSIVSGSDASFTNLDISANLNPYVANSSTIGLATKNWNSAYINNMYCETLRTYRSDNILTLNSNTLMISGDLFTSGNLNPFTNNTSSLGSTSKIWGNAYIRDLSANSIEVSGNIFPRDISSNLGSSLRRWDTLFADDISINKINGQVYNAAPTIVLTSLSSNLIPISNNTLKLGDVSNNWSNAYIRDLSVSSIDVSTNLNPLLANGSSLGFISKIWGNAYIRDISVGSIDVSSNSINPFIANGSSLGLPTRMWCNGYIRDLSVGSIDVSTNLNPLLASGSSLGLINKRWGNAYIRDMSVSSIDVSTNLNPLNANSSSLGLPTRAWANAYIRDMSVSSIDLSVNLTPLNANSSSLGLITRAWNNAYIRDLSISSIDVSSNLNPLIPNRSSLGLPSKIWGNAYIRDLSISNLDVSGNIIPLIPNNSNLGSSLNRWRNVFASDLSINTINGQAYTSGGGSSINLSSISGNIIPSTTNSLNLGSNTNYWNNGYIRNVVTSARAYQGISGDISGGNFGDISWSAVNGYYGLAKDAYPALNPRSSGDLAVSTWTGRTILGAEYVSCCWSPELRLFVAVSAENDGKIITSTNGINWLEQTYPTSTNWSSVCWSPQLRLFIAVATNAPLDRVVASSTNGNIWTQVINAAIPTGLIDICWSAELGIFVAVSVNRNIITSIDGSNNWIPRGSSNIEFGKICWSAELGIFVGTAYYGNQIMTSNNGIDWITITIDSLDVNTWIWGICWSSQLGIFVIVSLNGPHRVATSIDGINWTPRIQEQGIQLTSWTSVCWSAQLELFVAVSTEGSIMTSFNGIIWKLGISTSRDLRTLCWSPELGLFVSLSRYQGVLTSSLKGRPPTSYNVFDSSFNRIDENGKWDFSNIEVTRLTVKEIVVTSDDRLKHNEVAITNGLTIIDRLVPKFYQKTFDMLDASYNGDLSGYAWNYEAGLIAQEVLQISDLSYVVSGGDYYEKIIKYYDISANYEPRINYYDTSANYYDTNANYYDISTNYEISYNLVTQSYGVNYNSLLTYGLAAIKELHAKVKAQELILLEQQATINSLAARLVALEAK